MKVEASSEQKSATNEKALTRAQRSALWSFRITSSALKHRSQEQIESDRLIRRSLKIGALAVWFFWVAFTGFIGTGLLVIFGLGLKIPPALLGFVALITAAAIIAAPIAWIIGRISLSFALDASEKIASDARQNFSYRDIEQVQAERQDHEAELSRKNLKDSFVLRSLRWNGIRVFDDGNYSFSPRINVLLGKNGYGKTLLFRSLVALLQRDSEHSAQLFPTSPKRSLTSETEASARLIAEVTRNGALEEIVRDPLYFVDTCGKIPLLAIPDSRFINKSVSTVSSSPTGLEPLCESGARHYLTQEPYENVVLELLTQIGIDYIESKRGFDQPIFRLIESVVRELTEDEDFCFASIKRVGRTGFQIMVFTAGSRDEPVPIQAASQGTFSIIGIFGLIYSFLHSLNPDADPGHVAEGQAIVIIDELDAHLHPGWQQKIIGILASRFPRVQFIVSAHSPLIVAGCDFGEVAVLRRDKKRDRFHIQPLQRDFLGATAKDLYKDVFEIEDTDRLYLEYSTKVTMRAPEEQQEELIRLSSKRNLTEQDEHRIAELEREERLMDRAREVRTQRLDEEKLEAQVARLEDEVKVLHRKLAAVSPDPLKGSK